MWQVVSDFLQYKCIVCFTIIPKGSLLLIVDLLVRLSESRHDGFHIMVEVEHPIIIDIVVWSDWPSLINALLPDVKLHELLELVVVAPKSIGEPVNGLLLKPESQKHHHESEVESLF